MSKLEKAVRDWWLARKSPDQSIEAYKASQPFSDDHDKKLASAVIEDMDTPRRPYEAKQAMSAARAIVGNRQYRNLEGYLNGAPPEVVRDFARLVRDIEGELYLERRKGRQDFLRGRF